MAGEAQTHVCKPELMQELEKLCLMAPTFEIAICAVRLQAAILSYEFYVDHVLEQEMLKHYNKTQTHTDKPKEGLQ